MKLAQEEPFKYRKTPVSHFVAWCYDRVRKACRFHAKCNPSWLVSFLKCCFVAMASFSPTVPHLSSLLKAVWFRIFNLIFYSVSRMMYSGPVYAYLLHCVEVSDTFQLVPGYMEIPRVSQSAHSAPYKNAVCVSGVVTSTLSLCVPAALEGFNERPIKFMYVCLIIYWQFRHPLSNGACYHMATGFLYNTCIVCGITLMLSLKYPEGIDKRPWK